ncbi:MAG: hypothetical protein QXM96_03320 [Candidatus Woesearchaeota archaeon]
MISNVNQKNLLNYIEKSKKHVWEIPITIENIEQITFNQLKKLTLKNI